MTATNVLRLPPLKEGAVRVQFLIESMPLWETQVDGVSFDLPSGVVARIRDHAMFAANHGAREPKIAVKVINESKAE